VLNHGEPSWVVRGRTFAQYTERHPPARLSFWCPAPAGEREALVAIDPSRFFEPRFGGRDWVGVYLDVKIDWGEARELLTEAYCTVAPKKLASLVR
jgi:hypothetical protein